MSSEALIIAEKLDALSSSHRPLLDAASAMLRQQAEARAASGAVQRIIADAREFVEAANSEGFDAADALDLIREIAALSASPTEPPGSEGAGEVRADEWLDPASAPKDGTILELAVDYTDGHGALQDALIAPTIGWNDLANTGEDKWHIVGWDWCQDHIRDGSGLIRAWRASRLNACDGALGPLPTINGETA